MITHTKKKIGIKEREDFRDDLENRAAAAAKEVVDVTKCKVRVGGWLGDCKKYNEIEYRKPGEVFFCFNSKTNQ